MKTFEVPRDFPRNLTPAVVPGVHPKFGARLSDGVYAAGQTDDERRERWLLCEDLVEQPVPVAHKDALSHPQHRKHQTLERIRVSVARKA